MPEQQKKMQLSCLVDGELGKSEESFLLRRLDHDADLEGCWSRYHLYRDVMRKHRLGASTDLSERIMAALNEEPSPTPSRRGPSPWLKRAAGFAVAASVAVAAFNAFYVAPTRSVPEAPPVAQATASYENVRALPQRARVASGSMITGNDAAEDPRVQAYVLRHNQASARRGQGLVPYIYMISTPVSPEPVDDTATSEREASD